MTTLHSERAVVQNLLLRYATEAGWTYLTPDDALRLRRGESSPILWDGKLFKALLRAHLPDVDARETPDRK